MGEADLQCRVARCQPECLPRSRSLSGSGLCLLLARDAARIRKPLDLLLPLVYFFLVGFAGQAAWRRVLGSRYGRAFGVPLTLGSLVIVGAPFLSSDFAPHWPLVLAVIVGAGWIANLHDFWSGGRVWRSPHLGVNQFVLIGLVTLAVLISTP